MLLPADSFESCTPDGHMPHCFTRCQCNPSCQLSVLQDTVCRCLIDIAAGMDYLHSLGVLHGAQYSPDLHLMAGSHGKCSLKTLSDCS